MREDSNVSGVRLGFLASRAADFSFLVSASSSFHASDGALVAFPFLFALILKSPVQVSQDLEVFGRELFLGEHRRHDDNDMM